MLIVHSRRLAKSLGRSKTAVNALLQEAGFAGSREVDALRGFFRRLLAGDEAAQSRAATLAYRWAVRRIHDADQQAAFFRRFPSIVSVEVMRAAFPEEAAAPARSPSAWDLRSLLNRPRQGEDS